MLTLLCFRLNYILGKLFLLSLAIILSSTLKAQSLIYSDVFEKSSSIKHFEILGKVGNSFLLYRNLGNRHVLSGFNSSLIETFRITDQQLGGKHTEQIHFFLQQNRVWVIKQIKNGKSWNTEVQPFNESGVSLGTGRLIDSLSQDKTPLLARTLFLTSEDRSKLMLVYLIQQKPFQTNIFTTCFDSSFRILSKTISLLPLPEKGVIDDPVLDNQGNLAFISKTFSEKDKTNKSIFHTLRLESGVLESRSIPQLDSVKHLLRLAADNKEQRFIVVSILPTVNLSTTRLWLQAWTPGFERPLFSQIAVINNADVNTSDAQSKGHYNQIKRLSFSEEGKLFVEIESEFSQPYLSKNGFYTPIRQVDVAKVNDPPNWKSSWNGVLLGWEARPGPTRWSSSLYKTWLSQDINIYAFSNQGVLEWQNVLPKQQVEDEQNYVSFSTGAYKNDRVYLFNSSDKNLRWIEAYFLDRQGAYTSQSIKIKVERTHKPLTRFAKQMSRNEWLIPCFTSNRLCLAKLNL